MAVTAPALAPVPARETGPRVTLDARMIGAAGVGRMIAGLWRGLAELEADVIGLWPGGPPRDWMGPHRDAPAGPHVAVRARPFLPVEQAVLPAVLRRCQSEVHHAPFFAVPHLTRVPVVLTVHDLFPYLEPANARSPVAAAVYRTAVPAAVRRAAVVVAVSPYAARQVAESFAPARLRVVEHGIDHARWSPPSPEHVEAVRTEHRLPADYLLYVGTLKRHKNLATVLAAHRPEHPPLVLAGAGPAELARSGLPVEGRAIALGRVSDRTLAGLYGGARALVLPSLYEAVGFTALEAMACGAPVVCSTGGGLPDTVGGAALTVPPLDVEAWREALTTITEDDALRGGLTRLGLERVRARSWRAAAQGYLEVYREAAR